MDDALIEAFGFPRPSPTLRQAVLAALKVRAAALRLLPPRTSPKLRTAMRHRSYPQGYTMDRLGPPREPGEAVER
jgi:hypothetical protein